VIKGDPTMAFLRAFTVRAYLAKILCFVTKWCGNAAGREAFPQMFEAAVRQKNSVIQMQKSSAVQSHGMSA
jgi:hypothetical protein